MICHAILRRTRDWERVRPDSLDAPFLCRAAVQWERSFPLGYGACRARIKALSLEHLRALPARVTEAPTRRPADVDRAAVRDGDVVLLCDDDDLFHPRLIEHLETVRTAGSWDRVVIWPDGKHGFHKAPDGEGPVLLPRVLERPLDDENLRGPYVAIPGRLLRRTPEVLDAFWTHAATVETFANRRSPVAKVSTALSLTAKHPCSVSILRRALVTAGDVADDDLEGVLRGLIKQYVDGRTALPPGFTWAADYVAGLRGVFRDCLGRE